jgi:hypothetical protein
MIRHTLMRTLFVLTLLAVWLLAAPTLAQNLQVPAESDANQGLAATSQQVKQSQDDQEWLTAYMLAHKGYQLHHLDALDDAFGKMSPTQLHHLRLMYQDKYEASKQTDALLQQAQQQAVVAGQAQVQKQQRALNSINTEDTSSANLEDQRLQIMHQEANQNYQQEVGMKTPAIGYPGYYGSPYAPIPAGYGGMYRGY